MPKLKERVKTYLWHLLLGFDQLFNVVCGGMADETFSARCFRLDGTTRFWTCAHKVVDGIFWFEPKHCWQAFRNEQLNAHKPAKEYQK